MLDLNTVNQEDRSLNYQLPFSSLFTLDTFHSSTTMRSSPTRRPITPSSCPSTWVWSWVDVRNRFWSRPSWLTCAFSWGDSFRSETTIWMCLRTPAFWRRWGSSLVSTAGGNRYPRGKVLVGCADRVFNVFGGASRGTEAELRKERQRVCKSSQGSDERLRCPVGLSCLWSWNASDCQYPYQGDTGQAHRPCSPVVIR